MPIDENILWFYIQMQRLINMRIVQRLTNLNQQLQHLSLRELPTNLFLLPNQMSQVSIAAELHHYREKSILSIVETLFCWDNIRMIQLV